MSAIVALLQRNGAPADAGLVESLLAASPDRAVHGQRVWAEGPVALARAHFWVTPEEQGEQQPLQGSAGSLAIVSDARIDNRAELIHALGLAPEKGPTSTDGELILHAYERWGTACAERLLGDFVFVVWDAIQRHLFVARDALGMRGISYYLDSERCIVASEIKQILAHPAVEPRLNEGKVADYLAVLWDEQEETFYQGISYCPPAHCLLVTADGVRKWRYWDIDPEARVRYRHDAEYAEHFRALLAEAVGCRLRCAGPVGVSLSGGMDSTSVAALAAEGLQQAGRGPLRSFSYVFDELVSCDERPYIVPVVEQLGLDATYLVADDRWTLRDLERWPTDSDWVYHDPYAWLPAAVLDAAGQAGCRLLLSGHYGDMLFEGDYFWAADLMHELRVGQLLSVLVHQRRSILWRTDLVDHGLRALIPLRLKRAYRSVRPRPLRQKNPGLHPDLIVRTGLPERSRRDESWRRFGRPGQWERYRSLMLSANPQGLAAARRLYTARGLERADPYCDRRLVEYAMAVPADQLGRPARTRWVQRNAMRGRLPQAVLDRRDKTWFFELFDRGVLDRERATVEPLLVEPEVERRRYVRAGWLREQLNSGQAWPDHGYAWWLCISLELWLRRYWSGNGDASRAA